jgi:hypothetical protein
MAGDNDPNPSLTALQLLMRLQGGQFLHDLQGALGEVVQGVIATQKVGEIDVKITVDIVKNAPNAVFFKTTLKDKIPKPTAQSDILFVGELGSLHENNPKQRDIFGPRPVPRASFDPETGEVTGARAS